MIKTLMMVQIENGRLLKQLRIEGLRNSGI